MNEIVTTQMNDRHNRIDLANNSRTTLPTKYPKATT
jgi:hypothetical protein